MKEQPGDIRIVLRPLADGVPVPMRLKRLLKYALRLLGFRCLHVEEVKSEQPTEENRGNEMS